MITACNFNGVIVLFLEGRHSGSAQCGSYSISGKQMLWTLCYFWFSRFITGGLCILLTRDLRIVRNGLQRLRLGLAVSGCSIRTRFTESHIKSLRKRRTVVPANLMATFLLIRLIKSTLCAPKPEEQDQSYPGGQQQNANQRDPQQPQQGQYASPPEYNDPNGPPAQPQGPGYYPQNVSSNSRRDDRKPR